MRRLIIAVLAWLVVAPAFALDPYLWEPRPEDPRAYTQVVQRYQAQLDLYDYPTLFADLAREAEQSRPLKGAPEVRRNLLRAMDELNSRLKSFDTDVARAGREGEALDKFLTRYPTGLFQFPCPDVCFTSDYTVSYETISALPDVQAEDFLYRVQSIDRLLNDFKKTALQYSVQAIRNADQRWDIYLREGMSQFPWEGLLNAVTIGADDIQYPPERQWILLHPQLAVEISTNGAKNIRAKEALAVELIGHVWYRWRDSENPGAGLRWWGVSALTTLRDDMRPGIGIMAHYGRLISLGVTWHDQDNDDDWFNQSPYLSLSVDLFRFVEDRAPEYQKKWQQFRQLKELYGGGV